MSTTSTGVQSAPSWRAVVLFVGALVPALVAVLPLTMGAAWYLSADENEPYLSKWRVIEMLAAFAIAVAPFLAAVVALVSVRVVGCSWARACRVAAGWTFGLGCLAR